jgi:hypothetical protein
MIRALALLGLLLAATPAITGPCVPVETFQEVLTPPGETIDQFGGVVIANPRAVPWEFVEGPKRERARVTVIAPGLAIIAAKSFDQLLDLEDGKRNRLIRVKYQFQATDDMPVDSAPRVTALVQTKRTQMMRSDVVVATLGEAPPAGTIAVIVRAADSKASGARSWFAVTDLKAKQLDVYRHDRCKAEPAGTVGTKAGDKVMLAWVDSAGHVSLWTASIVVTAEK